MAKYNRKQVEAAIELSRLIDGPPKTRRLLAIMAEQMEAMLRIFDDGVRRARERELSQVLKILDPKDIEELDDEAFADAFDEEATVDRHVPIKEPMS